MKQAANRTLQALIITFCLWLSLIMVGYAQETAQLGQLFITGSKTDSFPSIQLRTYGLDGQGNPIDFATEPLFVLHNQFPADEVTFAGKETVGTLTVFVIDATSDVVDQLPAIQTAIQQYASPDNMLEQVDFVAIYQIGASGANQLLAPTQFYNGVNNLFVTTPIVAESGATSLYDGIVQVVDEIPNLKPNPNLAASIVLFGDGTDPGTSQVRPSDVPLRALSAGVPIHTVLLNNPNLGVGQELGRLYFQDVATVSRGIATELANPEGLSSVWARIAGFRDHALVRYTVPEMSGGTFPVELSLANDRDVKATTELTISAVVPSVTLDIPRESREITVRDLEDPVRLRLSASVTWLDGQQRALTAAALLVNGVAVAEIPVENLGEFEALVNNFTIGNNRLEIVATDNQGFQTVSPPVTITVNQGEQLALPEELQPSGGGFTSFLLLLLLVALLGLIGWLLWRRRAAQPATDGRKRRRRRTPSKQDPTAEPYSAETPAVSVTDDYPRPPVSDQKPFIMAHLDVLDAQTYMPEEITLGEVELRIGRSPAQSNIAFRDDITVSRFHAVLRLEGNRYRIYDAGSTSGTYVNGRQVPEYGLQLADGDEVQLGAVRLRYRQL